MEILARLCLGPPKPKLRFMVEDKNEAVKTYINLETIHFWFSFKPFSSTMLSFKGWTLNKWLSWHFRMVDNSAYIGIFARISNSFCRKVFER